MPLPTHTPAGRCRACGYPMDPGVCSECGTECPDVSPRARRRLGRWLALVAGAGSFPALATVASVALFGPVARRATRGMRPGDPRIGAAYRELLDALHTLHLFGVPAVTLSLVAFVAWRGTRRRPGRSGDWIFVAMTGWLVGLLTWVVSFGYLIGLSNV